MKKKEPEYEADLDSMLRLLATRSKVFAVLGEWVRTEKIKIPPNPTMDLTGHLAWILGSKIRTMDAWCNKVGPIASENGFIYYLALRKQREELDKRSNRRRVAKTVRRGTEGNSSGHRKPHK